MRLMFQDEARFGRVGHLRRCWAPSHCRPVSHSQIIREYIYAYSAVSPLDGKIDSLIVPRADSDIMRLFLKQVSKRFKDEHIVMVMDKAPWHTTGRLKVPENMSLVFLPPYSPQLNPVEHLWDEIREKFFGNRVFENIDAVENRLMDALISMNKNPECVRSLTGFRWIIDILLYI